MDILIGGKGADVFKISKGFDIVRDFSLAQGDKIGIQNNNYSIINTVNGVEIFLGKKRKILLESVDYNDIINHIDELYVIIA